MDYILKNKKLENVAINVINPKSNVRKEELSEKELEDLVLDRKKFRVQKLFLMAVYIFLIVFSLFVI